MVEKAPISVARAAEEPRDLCVQAAFDQHVVDIARILNRCLGMLDELGLSRAGAHLGAAIDALPGQSAVPPIDLLDLIADFPLVPTVPKQQFNGECVPTKPRGPR